MDRDRFLKQVYGSGPKMQLDPKLQYPMLGPGKSELSGRAPPPSWKETKRKLGLVGTHEEKAARKKLKRLNEKENLGLDLDPEEKKAKK
jgi:hypothetical protein